MRKLVVVDTYRDQLIVEASRVWESAYGAAFAQYYLKLSNENLARERATDIARAAVHSLEQIKDRDI